MASADTQSPLIPNKTTTTQRPAVEDEVTNKDAKGEEEVKKRVKKPKRPRALKLQAQDAHLAVVLEAARRVAAILQARGIPCAVFGSLASKLYGCPRHLKVRSPCYITCVELIVVAGFRMSICLSAS